MEEVLNVPYIAFHKEPEPIVEKPVVIEETDTRIVCPNCQKLVHPLTQEYNKKKFKVCKRTRFLYRTYVFEPCFCPECRKAWVKTNKSKLHTNFNLFYSIACVFAGFGFLVSSFLIADCFLPTWLEALDVALGIASAIVVLIGCILPFLSPDFTEYTHVMNPNFDDDMYNMFGDWFNDVCSWGLFEEHCALEEDMKRVPHWNMITRNLGCTVIRGGGDTA